MLVALCITLAVKTEWRISVMASGSLMNSEQLKEGLGACH